MEFHADPAAAMRSKPRSTTIPRLHWAGVPAPARTAAFVTALLVSSACATAPARAPAVRSIPAIEVGATLLRLEDRREYDAATLESAAALPDPVLRRRAALAGGRIGDRRAVPFLTRLLADADTSVAASAAFALGELGDSTAVPALVAYVAADRIAAMPTVVGEAALALGKMPASAAGRRAVEELLRTAPRSGPGVQHAVGQALLAVWRFPRPADVAPIVPWLDNADPELRWRAVYALSRRPSPDATRAVHPRASDTEPLARSFAVRALTRPLADSSGVGVPWGLLALLNATRDSLHLVSVNAARAMGTYDEQDVVERLVELLRGEDAYLAITAAESLGRLGTKAAWTSADLVSVALDRDRPVFLRTTALAALGEVAPVEVTLVADAFMREDGWRLRAAAARAYAATRAWDRVAELARDPDGRIAGAAVDAAVGEVGDSVAVIRAVVLGALEHPDAVVRTNALGGVARLADPASAAAAVAAYARAQRDSLLNDAALGALDALATIRRRDPAAGADFFSRFPRSADYLVRQRAAAVFGDSLAAAWGPPLPIETGRSLADYQSLVRRGLLTPSQRARIVTSRGEIELELFTADAPLTVENFLALARRGYFNGQEWPRVVPNFVIQGGDPRGDTSGGPGYAIRDEINRHPYGHGTLGMALSGPDTGGSQWFITHSPQPHLDGGYTVFGRVTRGMDVVSRIIPGDRILRIEEVR
ncbi:MAG TPA: peptidylprolyl isomerase [Longimicrobiaceae bacterium]|nr:peptidylprolyl isomerase [Longimicrobiaceae bacterium]